MDFSAGSLFASIVVSTVGFGIFQYGRKQRRVPQVAVGMALMGFPYFAAGPIAVYGIGVALVLGLWLATRAGL